MHRRRDGEDPKSIPNGKYKTTKEQFNRATSTTQHAKIVSHKMRKIKWALHLANLLNLMRVHSHRAGNLSAISTPIYIWGPIDNYPMTSTAIVRSPTKNPSNKRESHYHPRHIAAIRSLVNSSPFIPSFTTNHQSALSPNPTRYNHDGIFLHYKEYIV